MNKKPSEINKWLKGNHNLTLRTIARLEAELGDAIISVIQPAKTSRRRAISS
jgi:hypothetical protein